MDRERIITKVSHGKLKIKDGPNLENIRCEYTYDIYSNRHMSGYFETPYYYDEFENKSFVFTDEAGRIIEGNLNGSESISEINLKRNLLKFKINSITNYVRYTDEEPAKLIVYFYVPYFNFFERRVASSFNLKDEYIFKYSDSEKRIDFDNFQISFQNNLTLLEHIEPDSIACRNIYPTISIDNFQEKVDALKILQDLYDFVNDFFLIISLIFLHRVRSFGYSAKFLDSSDKVVLSRDFRSSLRDSGKDYVSDIRNPIFLKTFDLSRIRQLVINFRKSGEKDLIEDVIYRILVSTELNYFEPMLVWSTFSLEAISRLITGKKSLGFEDAVLEAVKSKGYNIDDFNFTKSTFQYIENKSNKWMFTDYRNNIAHFKNQNFDNEEIYKEYKKVLQLTRNLVFRYLGDENINYPTAKN
jgi:hypothetical protein